MHVLVTGGTGFIGQALLPVLQSSGHEITVLSRGRTAADATARYVGKLTEIEVPVDAVINLAGASLGGKRWNASYKAEIRDSRLHTTQALGEFLARQGTTPAVWLNASAIGFYGAHGDEALDEHSDKGAGFAADLCSDWEAAARKAAPEGTRLCLMRLGVVLERHGGAYAQMTTPFRMGIANWIGSGHQYLSWIHLRDAVAAIVFLLEHDGASGVFNLTAPEPVTSRGFCEALKERIGSPLRLPMPAFVMRAMIGEMADELLISGQRVMPSALQGLGFEFSYPTIAGAVEAIEQRR
ncbi:MAG: TIGR01777 family oxidoreductase [Halieaceae bacterium]|jgi:uncharacterized protein (TIGR01777 family)|nr:TIGR01777 family oxidoreductase [Halieaceae bacterium]